MPTISFGGLTITGDMSVDGFAVVRLQGWYDAAPSRAKMRDRPQQDGSFGVARFYRDARVISVEGDWVGESIAEAYEARDRLAALQADGIPSTFTVEDELGSRSVTAVLDAAPSMDDVLRAPFFAWSFDVVAADPKKYGTEQVVSTGLPSSGSGITYPITYPITYGTPGDPGRVTVSNPGSQETFSLFEVSGGLDAGFELKDISSGRRLRFERLVPLGSTVFVNPRTGRAYLDVPDNDVTGFLTVRDWWSVPAGVSQEIQFSSLGGVSGVPTLTARTKPAF